MSEVVNTRMLILARESRGINQAEMASRLGIMSTNLSKIERNDFSISENNLTKLAEITNYPVSFFYQQGDVVPENLNYRKREIVAQKVITPIHAKVNIIRHHVQSLTRTLSIIKPDYPVITVTDTLSPSIIAQKVKKIWGIKSSIINNMVEILEENGIVVSKCNFDTDRVDSRSVLTDDKYPIIVINDRLLGDRQRFSLAYQLGHLVMHTLSPVDANRDVAHDANLFAAEFLMPEREMRHEFKDGVSVPLLGELKRKWKVSMIALLYRADDLGFLTANQKRYLIQQFNSMKIRKREPVELDIAAEKPQLMRRWLAHLKTKKKFDTSALAAQLHLNVNEFIELYN